MKMNRRTLLGAAIAAPVAAVVLLLLPKSPTTTVTVLTVLDVDWVTAEALIHLKHINGRVERFIDRMVNRDREYNATGRKPIGWKRNQYPSTSNIFGDRYLGRYWRNEETGAMVTQEMIDHLRCCIEPDSDKRVYMVSYNNMVY